MTPRWLEFFGDVVDVKVLSIDEIDNYACSVVVVRGVSASRVLAVLGIELPDTVLRFAIYLDRNDPAFLVANAVHDGSAFRSGMYWIAGFDLPVHVTVDIGRLRNQPVRLSPPAISG